MYAQILGRAVSSCTQRAVPFDILGPQINSTLCSRPFPPYAYQALLADSNSVRGPMSLTLPQLSTLLSISLHLPSSSIYYFHLHLVSLKHITVKKNWQFRLSFFFGFFFIWVQGKCIPIGVFRIHLRSPSIQTIKSHATLFFFSKNTYCQKYVFLSFYIKRRRFLLRPPLRVKKLLLFWFYIPF